MVLSYEKGWPPGTLDHVPWAECREYVKGYYEWLDALPKDDKGNPIVPGRGLF